ncbi:MAG: translation initiation factor [Nonlabens sp.]
MDLSDQLKNLFPDHEMQEENEPALQENDIWMQDAPLECKFEKRKGKVNTVIDGYTGASSDFKALAKELKTTLGVGGSFKNDTIIIQGDYRDRIMQILRNQGFKVKRVGG